MVATTAAPGRGRHNSLRVMKHDLPPERSRLVELMQRINFGRIEDLAIIAGQPVLDPLPRRYREIKLKAENGARPESGITDFALKAEVLELFRVLDEVQDGVIETLEIRHGLPFRMTVEDVA